MGSTSAQSNPPSQISLDIDRSLAVVSEAKVKIVIREETPYLVKKREEEAEKARFAAVRRKAVPKRNLTVNSAKSGGVYYEVKNRQAWDCVNFLRRGLGVYVPAPAYAYRIKVKTKTPFVGAIIVTYEGYLGHFGKVIGVDENFVYIHDGNYRWGYETKRTLPINSSLIKGYL